MVDFDLCTQKYECDRVGKVRKSTLQRKSTNLHTLMLIALPLKFLIAVMYRNVIHLEIIVIY
jgi:hypothetical protein